MADFVSASAPASNKRLPTSKWSPPAANSSRVLPYASVVFGSRCSYNSSSRICSLLAEEASTIWLRWDSLHETCPVPLTSKCTSCSIWFKTSPFRICVPSFEYNTCLNLLIPSWSESIFLMSAPVTPRPASKAIVVNNSPEKMDQTRMSIKKNKHHPRV